MRDSRTGRGGAGQCGAEKGGTGWERAGSKEKASAVRIKIS